MSDSTLEYYNTHAEHFIQDTLQAGIHEIRDSFLKYITLGGHILDLGCGSGRDSLAFLQAGYTVCMVDGSEKMADAAEALTGESVIRSTFQDFRIDKEFDGIWACASLLHLQEEEIRNVVKRLANNLKFGAAFYMSFKYGVYSGLRNGRYFTDMTEERFRSLLVDIPSLKLIDERITGDVRLGREQEKWINVICTKA